MYCYCNRKSYYKIFKKIIILIILSLATISCEKPEPQEKSYTIVLNKEEYEKITVIKGLCVKIFLCLSPNLKSQSGNFIPNKNETVISKKPNKFILYNI